MLLQTGLPAVTWHQALESLCVDVIADTDYMSSSEHKKRKSFINIREEDNCISHYQGNFNLCGRFGKTMFHISGFLKIYII